MKFCDFCNNMLYVNINEAKDLLYYCKSCGKQEIQPKEQGSICVIDDNQINDTMKYSQYINKYLKYDPTLPRVDDMDCPNPTCNRNGKKNEVIYINYNPTDMKFVYFCCHCNHSWINNA